MAIPQAGLQFAGDFNSVGRGARVQQGVNYFSAPNIPQLPNINEAAPNPGAFDDGAPGAGVYQVPPEDFNGQGTIGATRATPGDFAANAVDGTRDGMLGTGFKAGLSILGGPAAMLGMSNPLGALAVNKAVDMGIDRGFAPGANAADTGMAARGFADMGMSFADAANLAQSNEGALPGMSYEAAAVANDRALMQAMAQMQADDATAAATAESAAAAQAQASAAQSSGNTTGGGYNGYGADDSDDGAYGPAGEFGRFGGERGDGTGGSGGRSNNDGGNDGGTGQSNGPSGGRGGDAGDSMADGGMVGERPVGLSTPGYADGGMMDMKGPMLAMGFNDGGMMGAQPNPQQIDAQVNQILRDPQVRQQLVARAQQLMQTGELTPEEVTTLGRVAEAAMFNPALYPQLRQFVMQQGMSPLPPTFDPMTIVKILAVSRALSGSAGPQAPGAPQQPGMQMGQGQATPPGQVPPTSQASMQTPPGLADGGMLQGPGTGRSDSIGTVNESSGQPVKVANGEYIIPEHIVRAKGRDFFDKMLRQYADVPKGD